MAVVLAQTLEPLVAEVEEDLALVEAVDLVEVRTPREKKIIRE